MSVRKAKRPPKARKAVVVAGKLDDIMALYRRKANELSAVGDRMQAHPDMAARSALGKAAAHEQRQKEERERAAKRRREEALVVHAKNALHFAGNEGSDRDSIHNVVCMLDYFNACRPPEHTLSDDDDYGHFLIIQQAVNALKAVRDGQDKRDESARRAQVSAVKDGET